MGLVSVMILNIERGGIKSSISDGHHLWVTPNFFLYYFVLIVKIVEGLKSKFLERGWGGSEIFLFENPSNFK